MFRRALLVSALALSLTACAGLAGEPVIVATIPPPTPAPTDVPFPPVVPVLTSGALIYGARCTDCHGLNGAGDGRLVQTGEVRNAGNFLDPAAASVQTPLEWYTTITNGRIQNLMPPWREALNAQQRWDVAYYTYTMHYTAEEIARGRALYAQHCAECHGETGRGDGPRAEEIAGGGRGIGDLTDPEAMAALSDRAIYVTVSEGMGDHMPAFAEWSEADRWAVTRYTRTLSLGGLEALGVPNSALIAQLAPAATAEPTAAAETGTVTGRIVNETAGGTVPADAAVELFVVREGDFAVIAQLTGTADADGAFTFSDVPVLPGARYIARTIYRDNLYTSRIIPASEFAAGTLDLTIPIYELTEDPAVLTIERMVTQMTAVGESLEVLHVISFSNNSDRAYVTSERLDDGRPIALIVSLPPGAVVTGFGEAGRYAVAQEQFAIIDTLPVLPGSGHLLQIVYLLDYGGDAIVEQELNYRLAGPVRLLVRPPALQITGEQFPALGTEQVGANVFAAYGSTQQLDPGAVLRFRVAGAGVPVTQQGVPLETAPTSALPILIIGGLLAEIALIAGLYVWYRRRKDRQIAAASAPSTSIAPPVDAAARIDALIRQIAELDAAFEAGSIAAEAYQGSRAALKAELARLMEKTGRAEQTKGA
ncbi:MAG: c-type cytochrome [Candidatus Flexifilum sp.]